MCEKITVLSAIYLIISFLSFGLLLYGVFLFMGVLFARVNPTEFEDRGVKGDSLIFFSSIYNQAPLTNFQLFSFDSFQYLYDLQRVLL